MLTRRTLVVLSALLPLADLAAHARDKSDLFVLNNHLFIDVSVNGRHVRALLDSAAKSSIVDRRFARQIGLVAGRAVRERGNGANARLAEHVTIDVAGLTLGPLTVAVVDLSHIGRSLLNEPLLVVVGRELFDAARLAIDIERGRIRVLPRTSEPDGVALDLHSERGIETFPATVEDRKPVRTVFDLANGLGVVISRAYANRVGLLSGTRPTVKEHNGEIARRIVTLGSLEIGGHRFENVSATVGPTGSAAALNVGVSILRHFFITVDYAQHRLWLRD